MLLPASVLLRRADAVTVIGAALLAKTAGCGHRRVADLVGRAASTSTTRHVRVVGHDRPPAVADYYRRGPRAVETPTPPDAVVWHTAAAAEVGEVEVVVERVAVGVALAGLPAETRRAVVLRVAAGLPIAVVARRMHRGKPAVLRLTADGLTSLRAELTDAPVEAASSS